MVLIATGLYGNLSYRVSKRNAEIGLRMALGAQRWQIVWMVLRGSLLLTTMSVVIGIPLAIAASRGLVFLRQFLTGKTASVSYTYGDGRDSQEIAKTFHGPGMPTITRPPYGLRNLHWRKFWRGLRA